MKFQIQIDLSIQEKKFETDFQDGDVAAILDFCFFLPSFESTGLSVQEKKFKIDFSTFTSGGHLVHWSETILAILIESHLGNIPVKFDCSRLRV